MRDRRRIFAFNKHLLHRADVLPKNGHHLDVALLELLRDDLARRQAGEGIQKLELRSERGRVAEPLRQHGRQSFLELPHTCTKLIGRVLEFCSFGVEQPVVPITADLVHGLREVLVPRHPGVFAALGLLYADLRHHAHAPFSAPLGQLDLHALSGDMRALASRVEDALADDGVAPDARRLQFSADLRYVGQHHELDLELPSPEALGEGARADIIAAFHAMHAHRYGYSHDASPVEMTSVHVIGSGLQL